MQLLPEGKSVRLLCEDKFSLEDTLFCGQCFTFQKKSPTCFFGVVGHLPVTLTPIPDGCIADGLTIEQAEQLLVPFLDFDTDYTVIRQKLNRNPVLRSAMDFCGGIHLLRQDPFETLISFIVSQNNNIPRIEGILQRLRRSFGAPLGDDVFDFPTPEVLAACTPEDLIPLRSGFRAKYIVDAAKKVSSGEVCLSALPQLSMEEAKEALMTIQGVGPKVADCVLLFALGHRRAFPKDVWILRTMEQLFPKGLPAYFSPYEGYAQQYLFHYVRSSPGALPAKKEKEKK